MSRKSLARLRIASVLKIIVTDGELSVRLLNVRVVHNADITTSENRSFIGIASDCELSQIEAELFS